MCLFDDAQVLDSVESDEELQADLASVLVIPVAQYGHSHLVQLLTDYGADLAETDPSRGGPPLMHAANNGHAGTVTALLRVGLLFCCFRSFCHCQPVCCHEFIMLVCFHAGSGGLSIPLLLCLPTSSDAASATKELAP